MSTRKLKVYCINLIKIISYRKKAFNEGFQNAYGGCNVKGKIALGLKMI